MWGTLPEAPESQVCPAELSRELLLGLMEARSGNFEVLLVAGERGDASLRTSPVSVFTLGRAALDVFRDLCGSDSARAFLVRYEDRRLAQIACQEADAVNLERLRREMRTPGAALLEGSDLLAGLKLHLRQLTRAQLVGEALVVGAAVGLLAGFALISLLELLTRCVKFKNRERDIGDSTG